MQTTPLNQRHRDLGAKMVDFGGWDMPLHYGSQIEEHHQVRRAAGMFDVSHMRVVDLRGAGCRTFLRQLLANNIDKLKQPGKALYACMLNPDGGVIDDLIVYHIDAEFFRLVVNAGTAEGDLAWITRQRDALGLAVEIINRNDLAMIAVQGPEARARLWQALPASEAVTTDLKAFFGIALGEYFIARTGYTGEDGFEVMLPASEVVALWDRLLAVGVVPCGLGARDTLRLEAGMNLYGQDMNDATSPLESGLAWTVDLDPTRDFIGKAALQAAPPQQQLVGLALVDRGVLRAHQIVHTPLGDGEITSGTFSPTLSRSIALARVPVGVATGSAVAVTVRDKPLQAIVVKYPFVRHGESLIDSAITPKDA